MDRQRASGGPGWGGAFARLLGPFGTLGRAVLMAVGVALSALVAFCILTPARALQGADWARITLGVPAAIGVALHISSIAQGDFGGLNPLPGNALIIVDPNLAPARAFFNA